MLKKIRHILSNNVKEIEICMILFCNKTIISFEISFIVLGSVLG